MARPPSNEGGRTPQLTRREQPIGSSRSRSRSRLNCVPSSRNERVNQACWYWEKVNDAQGIAYRKKLYWFALWQSAEEIAKKRPKCPGREVSPPPPP